MARTQLPVTKLTRHGFVMLYPTAPANVDGHSIQNDGTMFFGVETANSPVTVTIRVPKKAAGHDVVDKQVTFPDPEIRYIGPFPPSIYNQPDGTILVDFSQVVNVFILGFRI
jgi:hypothetical protein